jgi:hypothetical protein
MAETKKTLTDIVGSGMGQWVRDPATGKWLTAQETIERLRQAIEAGYDPGIRGGVDLTTGQFRESLTPAEKLNMALSQLIQNIQYEGSGFPTDAAALLDYLGQGKLGQRRDFANETYKNISRDFYKADPKSWAISQDKIGKVFDVPQDDGPTIRSIVLDPNQKTLTPEQIELARQNPGIRFLDPVSGLPVFGVMAYPEGLTGPIPQGNIPWENLYRNPFAPTTSGFNSAEEAAAFAEGRPYSPDTLSTAPTSGNKIDKQTQSAIDVLSARFAKYGLSSLVPKIKELAIKGASEAGITLQLQETDEYKQRFKANYERQKKGLSFLDPGEYIGLEDSYRQILRAYGLKQFDNDDYVTQFLANDVSTAELSSRVVTAVQRVQNADPAVFKTLRDFYGIGVTDMVAYVLDPNQQFPKIERQVAAAEIGAAARLQGLEAGVVVAEQLAAQGITQAEARRGYSTIADILPQANKLSEIYTGVLDEYGQAEAEQEVFNSLASAQRKRKSLIEREVSAFSGSSGLGRTSLDRATGGGI